MEKGAIAGGPVLDEVETRIHPELTTEDEVEQGAPNLAVGDIVMMKDEQRTGTIGHWVE